MRWIVGNALSRGIIITLMAIAVLGSYSLAAAEPIRAAGLAAEWQGGLSGGAYFFFPEQTKDPALFAQSDDTRNLPLRMDSQRVSTFWGVNGSEDTFYTSQFRKNSKNGIVSIKDTIIVNLRI